MRKNARLTERDLTRLVKRVIQEQLEDETDTKGMNINDVLEFAYEYMSANAPTGPRDKELYRVAINNLERNFASAIRQLKGNITIGDI